MSELSPTPPRAGRWATPLTCQFKYLFFELTLFKHCSEAFTSFNLKGKNIKVTSPEFIMCDFKK